MKTRTWILGQRTARAWMIALALSGGAAQAAGSYEGPGGASQLPANVSSDLAAMTTGVEPDEMVRVIVGVNGTMSTADRNRIQTMLQSWGGEMVEDEFDSYSGYVAACPAYKIGDLARDAKSDHLSPDRTVRAAMDIARPTVGGSGGGGTAVYNVLASTYHLPDDPEPVGGGGGIAYTGSGVTVAVIDSGIAVHADLKTAAGADRVVVRWSALSGTNVDEFGHGTHVAGILGGNGKKSSGAYATRTFKGLAPDVRLVSMKVLGPDGSGQVSGVLEAIDWLLQNRQQYNIKVVNLSLGHPVVETCAKDPLCQGVESLAAAGMTVVVSAGNWGTLGYGSITSPGIAPNVITVGATKDVNTTLLSDDDITTYSSRGPTWPDHVLKPDLVAPGNKIVSLRLAGGFLDLAYPELRVPARSYTSDPALAGGMGDYAELSGTSMAAPIVSGVIAQMLQAQPALTPATIKARLMKSARKIGTNPFKFGAGLVDLPAALAATGTATAAPSPVVHQDPDEPGLLWIDDVGELWGDTAIWGDTAVWGDTAIWGDTAVWGDTAIWGDTAVWGDSILVNGDPYKNPWRLPSAFTTPLKPSRSSGAKMLQILP